MDYNITGINQRTLILVLSLWVSSISLTANQPAAPNDGSYYSAVNWLVCFKYPDDHAILHRVPSSQLVAFYQILLHVYKTVRQTAGMRSNN